MAEIAKAQMLPGLALVVVDSAVQRDRQTPVARSALDLTFKRRLRAVESTNNPG